MSQNWNQAAPAMLVVDGGPNDGRTIIIAKPAITFGRLPENDLVVNEPAVSRRHAQITRTDTGYYLRDLNTTNGTFVNGRNLGNAAHLLQQGDRISLARTPISFVFALDESRTIQLPRRQPAVEAPGEAEAAASQPGARLQQAEALQQNLRQLEEAYRQATNYAQQLSEELKGEREQQDRSIQRRAAQVARDAERKRLAEELHDETMGDLAAMSLEVGLLRRQAGKLAGGSGEGAKEVEASLSQLGDRLRDTNLRLRQMVQGIAQGELTDNGLVAAFKAYLEDLSKRPIANPYPLAIEFRVQGFGADRLPEEAEAGLFRVAQQAVTNAIQHARARKLAVELNWRDDGVTLSVADDGVGFDVANPKETPASGHFGLSHLKDRIEALHGNLEITSRESQGTTVLARVPAQAKTPRPTQVETSSYRVRIPPPARPATPR